MNQRLTATDRLRRWGAIACVSAVFSVGAIGCASAPKQVSDAIDVAESVATDLVETVAEFHAVNLDERGRALHGYDPVAYFTEGEAVPGREAFSLEWDNAVWYFASEANRDAFESDPEQYAPANGGFCTFGIVLSKKFDGDPEVWSIRDNRLYVFLNEDVKVKFLQDVAGNLHKVATNWPVIKDRPAEALN